MRKVVELFAGVGGFRVGLNNVKIHKNKVVELDDFKFVFFNQWEPNSKIQHAYNCYMSRFDEKFNINSNTDISKINKNEIPDHDLLVGGFPCQDYSVARSLKNEEGIEGKKGVLWWEIYNTLKIKQPNFVLLENVDRLLISPSKCRGRDFSIMLKCFDKLNYFVEWKVINASDYGMPQKRKRLFIFACKKTTNYFNNEILPNIHNNNEFNFINNNKSFFSKYFKNKVIETAHLSSYLDKEILEISDSNYSCTYYDSGIMINSKINSFKTSAIFKGEKKKLSDVLINDSDVSKDLVISDLMIIDRFRYLKSSKKINRVSKDGHKYTYSEGKMDFPDNINKPSRTMLTSESSINRSSHVVPYKSEYRYLSPVECERLNMFPDNWTNLESIPKKIRYFLMGNALVCGIIKKIRKELIKAIDMEKN
ncbi:DNA (cytosine-5-)-methyltransferase [Malacoplasma iowae]|uniref:DNA (cytosine-5-)-methyltransferase n=1 Tax=Malacoplasma iowae TaxID=2116 RepID=UPI00387390F6|nr:DNA (cytosine-5-)-methyltransferase [Malacoplasma iowae]